MSLAGGSLLTGLSKFVDDYWSSTTTGTGLSTGSTLVDTGLEQFGDGRLSGWWIRFTDTGTNQYSVSRVTANTQSSGTVVLSPPMPAQVTSGKTYELHKY